MVAVMAVAAISAGCAKEQMQEPEAKTVTYEVSAPSSETEETKVSITEGTWAVQWQKGDALGGWASPASAFTEFTMGEFTDGTGQTAAFSGSASSRLVYPYISGTATVADGKATVDVSRRECDIDVPFYKLSNKGYMISDVITPASTTYDGVTMHNLMAALKIRLKFTNLPADSQLLRVELTGKGATELYTAGTINLAESDNDKVLAGITPGTIRVDVNNSPTLANGTVYSLSTMIVPTKIVSGDANGLTIRVYVTGGYKEFTFTTTGSDIDLSRNRYNTFSKVCDMSSLTAFTDWLGTGTEDDPYLISTKADLELIATNVNGSSYSSYSGIYFKMTGDIDLKGDADNQWTAIGPPYSESQPFKGNFDGNGHTISGLYIDKSSVSYQGVFGYINGGSVSNLAVGGKVTGYAYVGSIVGDIESGTVSNCSSTASVSGKQYVGLIGSSSVVTIKHCSNSGSITCGESGSAGGIVGFAARTDISDCFNYGAVYSTSTMAGGISGQSSTGSISNCYNSGVVTAETGSGGGIVGLFYNITFDNCINEGDVKGPKEHYGGIAGVQGSAPDTSNSTFLNCVNRGNVTGGTESVGGVLGGVVNGFTNDATTTLINCTNSGQVIPTEKCNYVGGIVGYGEQKAKSVLYLVNCSNSGTVGGSSTYGIGGVIGLASYGSMTNCTNTGTVSGSGSNVGGVAGSKAAAYSISNSYYLTSCATDGNSTPQYGVGASVKGNTTSDIATSTLGLSSDTMVGNGTVGSGTYSDKSFVTALNAAASAYNAADPAPTYKACGWSQAASTYPKLDSNITPAGDPVAGGISGNWADAASPNFGGGTGSEANPFLITSAAELAHLAVLVNGVSSPYVEPDPQSGKYFRLACDIDLDGKEWTTIGKSSTFSGTFDGGGHSIDGLYIGSSFQYAGLFGSIDGAKVMNFNISGNISTGGSYYTGMVCASIKSRSSVVDCHSTGTISATTDQVGGITGLSSVDCTIQDCSFAGTVSGKDYVGGIVGSGNVGTSDIRSIIKRCITYGKVNGAGRVGGICGWGKFDVVDCVNKASVIASDSYSGGIGGAIYGSSDVAAECTGCINYGSVTGQNYTAGICGYPSFATFSKATNYGTIAGKNAVGGICAKLQYAPCDINYGRNFGSISGVGNIGGVVGSITTGTVTNSGNAGAVSGKTSSNISGVGGIAGNAGSKSSDASLTNCFNTGAIHDSGTYGYVGGICGSYPCKVSNCFNVGTVTKATGYSYSGSVSGMKDTYNIVSSCYYLSGCATDGSATPVVQFGFGSMTLGSNTADDASGNITLGLTAEKMKSKSTEDTNDLGSGNYTDKNFLEALNAGVAAYNGTTPAPTIAACSWKQTEGSYPELDF